MNLLSLQRLLLPSLLFSSGLCGIAYEILYGRLLANIIGDQFLISTAVLLTFLHGIGLGALHSHSLWRGFGSSRRALASTRFCLPRTLLAQSHCYIATCPVSASAQRSRWSSRYFF